jgi:hypothetical protein
MSLYNKILYGILVVVFIIIFVMVYNEDKVEQDKYYKGLPCNTKSEYRKMQIKVRDGICNGFLTGLVTGGPVRGIITATRFGLVGPIISGLSYLRHTDDNLIRVKKK